MSATGAPAVADADEEHADDLTPTPAAAAAPTPAAVPTPTAAPAPAVAQAGAPPGTPTPTPTPTPAAAPAPAAAHVAPVLGPATPPPATPLVGAVPGGAATARDDMVAVVEMLAKTAQAAQATHDAQIAQLMQLVAGQGAAPTMVAAPPRSRDGDYRLINYCSMPTFSGGQRGLAVLMWLTQVDAAMARPPVAGYAENVKITMMRKAVVGSAAQYIGVGTGLTESREGIAAALILTYGPGNCKDAVAARICEDRSPSAMTVYDFVRRQCVLFNVQERFVPGSHGSEADAVAAAIERANDRQFANACALAGITGTRITTWGQLVAAAGADDAKQRMEVDGDDVPAGGTGRRAVPVARLSHEVTDASWALTAPMQDVRHAATAARRDNVQRAAAVAAGGASSAGGAGAGRPPTETRPGLRCWTCGGAHMRRDCPTPTSSRRGAPRSPATRRPRRPIDCWTCGGDHVQRDCREYQARNTDAGDAQANTQASVQRLRQSMPRRLADATPAAQTAESARAVTTGWQARIAQLEAQLAAQQLHDTVAAQYLSGEDDDTFDDLARPVAAVLLPAQGEVTWGKQPLAMVQIEGANTLVLLDAGATVNVIFTSTLDSWPHAEAVRARIRPSRVSMTDAFARTAPAVGQLALAVVADGYESMAEFIVYEGAGSSESAPVIMGTRWLGQYGPTVYDWQGHTVTLGDGPRLSMLPQGTITAPRGGDVPCSRAMVARISAVDPQTHMIPLVSRGGSTRVAVGGARKHVRFATPGAPTGTTQKAAREHFRAGAAGLLTPATAPVGYMARTDMSWAAMTLRGALPGRRTPGIPTARGAACSPMTARPPVPGQVTVEDILSHVQHDACTSLTPAQHKTLCENMLVGHEAAFGSSLLHRPPVADVEIDIDVGGAAPVSAPRYRSNPEQEAAVDAVVEELLAAGLVVPSTSRWSLPLILVAKPTGGARVCYDARRLNALVNAKHGTGQLPSMGDVMAGLKPATYRTVLDLTSAFHQLKLSPRAREICSFRTRKGTFSWTRMPMGYSLSSRHLHEVLSVVLAPHAEVAVHYADDVTIFTTGTAEQHMETVAAVLQSLMAAGFVTSLKKIQLLCENVKFLGYVVGRQGVHVSTATVQAVTSFPRPTTVQQVRRFLGLATFVRRHVPRFSSVVAPLTDLTKAKRAWRWGVAEELAFVMLKTLLTTPPGLQLPNWSQPFIITSDASDIGAGAVLAQLDVLGHERPVAYWSRKFSAAERRWTTTGRELAAATWATREWRYYVHARHDVHVVDHANLVHMIKGAYGDNARVTRHLMTLAAQHVTLVHRPGRSIAHADALSRVTDPPNVDRMTVAARRFGAANQVTRAQVAKLLREWKRLDEARAARDKVIGHKHALADLAQTLLAEGDGDSDSDELPGSYPAEVVYHGPTTAEAAEAAARRASTLQDATDAATDFSARAARLAVASAESQADLERVIARYAANAELVETHSLSAGTPADTAGVEAGCTTRTAAATWARVNRSGERHMRAPHKYAPVTLPSPKELRTAQLRHPMYADALLALENQSALQPAPQALTVVPPVPYHPTWTFELDAAGDGVLCVRRRPSEQPVPVIPARYRDACMAAAHDLPITGHMGREVTLQRLQQSVWWPGQAQHVAAFVSTCVACACRKRAASSKTGKMVRVDPTVPMHTISSDLVGPLPKGTDGARWILTIMCRFTRWLEAVPMTSISAEAIAKALADSWITRYGVPAVVVFDNAPQLWSGVMLSLWKLLGVRGQRISAYHCQSNAVERQHRTIHTIMTMLVGEGHADWVEQLPFAVMAIRSAHNRIMGVSPHMAVFGRPMNMPLAALTGGPLPQPPVETQARLDAMLTRMATLQRSIVYQQSRQRAAIEAAYNREHHPALFKPGDAVLLSSPALEKTGARKWAFKHQAGWTVVKQWETWPVYQIRFDTTGTLINVNAQRLSLMPMRSSPQGETMDVEANEVEVVDGEADEAEAADPTGEDGNAGQVAGDTAKPTTVELAAQETGAVAEEGRAARRERGGVEESKGHAEAEGKGAPGGEEIHPDLNHGNLMSDDSPATAEGEVPGSQRLPDGRWVQVDDDGEMVECVVCGRDDGPLLLCDGQRCPVAIHAACTGFPLYMPDKPYFCQECVGRNQEVIGKLENEGEDVSGVEYLVKNPMTGEVQALVEEEIASEAMVVYRAEGARARDRRAARREAKRGIDAPA